uniref:NADH-ubiquinone oxidoreductase chain 2 n=1 Tax=Stenotrachelus aeneus TaxID=1501903 RepID=A0A343A3K0_9CUCU|nr:NADH dehydrogenase subunit 2 [Stenotrachelus aeneus]
MLFLNSMIMGTLISISSYSWMGMWMGLEINLLSMIPLFNSTKNMYSSESSLKYFLSQTMASLILLYSIILMLIFCEFITPMMNFTLNLMLDSALLTKLGAAPFHFWFPEVMEGLSWMNCLLLLTWQKIAPMMLIMNKMINMNLLFMVIFLSLLISGLMGLNQTSLRKIMAFSSINHIAWMLSVSNHSYSVWTIYFITYSIISLNLIWLFNMSNSFFLKQMFNLFKNNKMLKLFMMMNFFSLGGLPPFIGFLPKWLVINFLINNNLFMQSFLLIIFTLITLYIYIRMMLNSLVMFSEESKILNSNMNMFFMLFINFSSLMLLIICTLIFNFI